MQTIALQLAIYLEDWLFDSKPAGR